VITHIYVAKLKPGTSDEQVVAWLEAIQALEIEGMLELTCGPDLGIREGCWDVAITADFVDAAAWHRYNDDTIHNQIRNEQAKPIVEAQQRVQFERSRHFEVPGDIRNVTLLSLKADAPAVITDPDARAAYAELAGKTIRQAQRRIVELLGDTGDLVGEPTPVTHAVRPDRSTLTGMCPPPGATPRHDRCTHCGSVLRLSQAMGQSDRPGWRRQPLIGMRL